MSGEFKPQETSMNSFTETEAKLYTHFRERGHGDEVAKAIARNFTQFMLGYVTAEGAAQYIRSSGADEATAREIAELFRAAKEGNRSRHRSSHHEYASAGR